MTMYLPNPDLQPTGSEVTEFIDLPPMGETPGPDEGHGGDPEPGVDVGEA